MVLDRSTTEVVNKKGAVFNDTEKNVGTSVDGGEVTKEEEREEAERDKYDVV